MKIVIDARMYGLEHAGIGRYILNLIDEIEKLDKKNDYFILLRKKYYSHFAKASTSAKATADRSRDKQNSNFQAVLADYPHYSWQEQIFLPVLLFKLKPDVVHFPHFNVPLFWCGKYVVTIHDLIKHQFRGGQMTTRFRLFYWFKYLNYRFLVWLVVKRAAKIITPSHWWKKELIKRYHLPPTKINVTYEGVEKKFQIPNSKFQIYSARVLGKYKIKKPFVIYTGSLYPHKNVERLVLAVKKIKFPLVIVCGRNVFLERFEKRIKKLKAENLVTLTGFVPDEELVALYQQAEAFVFPSLLEGFGLPGLEAMAVGLPVLASNSSCLPEVYGPAAIYFDPLNVNEMASKIKKIISDKRLKQKMIKLGYQQVKKYSWQKMAKETLRVYNVL